MISQNISEYSLVINFEHDFQRVETIEGFTDIFTLRDDESKPIHLLYVINTSIDTGIVISDLYENDEVLDALYQQLMCSPKSKPKKESRGNTKGYFTDVEFTTENSSTIPGILYSTIQEENLYHILIMIQPGKGHLQEIDEILSSFQIN